MTQDLPKTCARSIFTWIINPCSLVETDLLKYFSHWMLTSRTLKRLLFVLLFRYNFKWLRVHLIEKYS